jgi:hypothetical protein
MNEGWICLHRKLRFSAVFDDAELLKLWTLCLLLANHEDRQVIPEFCKHPVMVRRGQFITGRFALAAEYNWRPPGKRPKRRAREVSPITVWRWLECLQNLGNLSIQTSNRFSLVTITRYGHYNDVPAPDDQTSEQQMNNRRSTSDQQVITNNNEEQLKQVCVMSRSSLPCDNPELFPAAKRVVTHYQETVRPAHNRKGGEEAAIGALLAGHDEAALCRAADAYARWCSRNGREGRYRDSVRTFYAETYPEYLTDAALLPTQADEIIARMLAQRERAERERKEAGGG